MKTQVLYGLLVIGLTLSTNNILAQTTPNISYSSPTNVFPVGTAISTLMPANTGGAVPATTYSAVSTLVAATALKLSNPNGLATDGAGNIYEADNTGNVIYKITSSGTATIIAGTGTNNEKDNPGATAKFSKPLGIVYDGSGFLYVTDNGGNTIRRVSTSSPFTVTTIAGSATASETNNTTGTLATFNGPSGIAYDGSGFLYVTDNAGNTIRKISTTSPFAVTTIAGTGAAGESDNTTGTLAAFNVPTGVAYNAGNLYVTDFSGFTIRQVSLTSPFAVTTIAGIAGNNGETDNATGTSARFKNPSGIVYGRFGNLYVCDNANTGNTIRQVSLTAPYAVSTLAGSGTKAELDGTGLAAQFYNPYGIAIDNSGNLFVGDDNTATGSSASSTLRKILLTGYGITPTLPAGLTFDATTGYISGTPTASSPVTVYNITGYNAAGSSTTTVTISCIVPPVISYTPSTNVYTVGTAITPLNPVNTGDAATSFSISPTLPGGMTFTAGNGRIEGTPTIASPATVYTITATNIAGAGSTTVTITCSPAPAPSISYSPSTNAYVVGAAITTLSPVNTGAPVSPVSFADGTNFSGVTLNAPYGLAIDAAGNFYVADSNNGLIRKYNSAGVYLSDFGSGVTMVNPTGLAFDSSGNAYVMDKGTNEVYKLNAAGVFQSAIITGVNTPRGIAIDASGNIYLANSAGAGSVVKYDSSGTIIFTITTGISFPDGIALDASGNIYVSDKTNNAVIKYDPTGTTFSTFLSGFNGPFAVAMDGAGNIYVADTGNNIVDVYDPTGTTLLTSISGFSKAEGVTVDAQGNLYVADFAANTVTRFGAFGGYYLSATLPPGLNFDSTTGNITGTPAKSSKATVYTVSAYSNGSLATTNITISCYRIHDWTGATSSDWNDPTNWSTGVVPSVADRARIGTNSSFTQTPVISSATQADAISFGKKGSHAAGVTANAVLTVTGDITYQSDDHSNLGYTGFLQGTGTISAANLNIVANTPITGSPYTETLSSSVNNLSITGNISLTSEVVGADAFDAAFNITGGITSAGGIIQTTNTAGSTSTISVANGTLQLANAAPLSGLSALGTNVVTFNNTGATVEYSGAAQTVYTDAGITGLPGGVSYQGIKFSGTGIKTVGSGNLNITGDFANTLANDAGDYIDLTTPAVNFNGTTQNLAGGAGNGTKLYNVTFSGLGTKTMASGSFSVASNGLLTMAGSSASTELAAGGLLTLNSDAAGSATIPAFTGPRITGNVNVQRFITGGSATYRGYRLVTSTVNNGSGLINLNYLKNSSYITGTTGTAGGFDNTSGGNPTLYLFRENLAPSNSSFTSGNFRGINDLTAAPAYSIDGDGSGFNIPVGNGFLFFFRGDRSTSFASKTTFPFPAPENTTLTGTGVVNQGPITVIDWYTPASSNLGFTNTPGNGPVQGFNLVGNPYPSSIDWDQLDSASASTGIGVTKISPFVYILDSKSKNYNVYEAGFGGSGTLADTLSNIIPAGQGFFVVATDPTAQLVFNESAKINTQATAGIGNLFLGPPPQAAVTQYLRLNLVQDSINTDGMFVSFKKTARPQYAPGEDAMYKPGTGTVSLSSLSADSVSLAVNTQALPNLTPLIIPLNVSAAADGIYQLNLKTIKSVPDLFDIWLFDAYNKDSLDFKHNPTYSFNIARSDVASYGPKRFTLVMRQNPALGIHLLNFTGSKATNGAELVWKTENEQNYTNFTVERSSDGGKTFDVVGGLASSALGTYSLLDKNPPAAADEYRLKIEDLNGNITYSNIVTLMYANPNNKLDISKISVYPNPTRGPVNLDITQTVGNPVYNIQIVNNLGAVIKTATSAQPTWQTDVSQLLPGTYFIRVANSADNSMVGKSAFVKL